MLKTQRNDPNAFVSPSGETFAVEYSPFLEEDGTYGLKEIGRYSIPEKINSYAETCDMHYILQQLKAGNTSVLSSVKGMFGDFTNVPKTPRDALQQVIDGQIFFDKLPVEIKQRFDNSFEKWFISQDTPSWKELMQMPIAPPKSDLKEEPTVDTK